MAFFGSNMGCSSFGGSCYSAADPFESTRRTTTYVDAPFGSTQTTCVEDAYGEQCESVHSTPFGREYSTSYHTNLGGRMGYSNRGRERYQDVFSSYSPRGFGRPIGLGARRFRAEPSGVGVLFVLAFSFILGMLGLVGSSHRHYSTYRRGWAFRL